MISLFKIRHLARFALSFIDGRTVSVCTYSSNCTISDIKQEAIDQTLVSLYSTIFLRVKRAGQSVQLMNKKKGGIAIPVLQIDTAIGQTK